MYQLPDLAKATSDDQHRAAEHHQLCARAHAARRHGPRRGIVRVTGLRLRRRAALRRAPQAF
jgi:hypothetical protein